MHPINNNSVRTNDNLSLLSSVPADILTNIFKECSFDDLYNLNYLCKNFVATVNKHLFEHRLEMLTLKNNIDELLAKGEYLEAANAILYHKNLCSKQEMEALILNKFSDKSFYKHKKECTTDDECKFLSNITESLSYDSDLLEVIVKLIKSYDIPQDRKNVLFSNAILSLDKLDKCQSLTSEDKFGVLLAKINHPSCNSVLLNFICEMLIDAKDNKPNHWLMSKGKQYVIGLLLGIGQRANESNNIGLARKIGWGILNDCHPGKEKFLTDFFKAAEYCECWAKNYDKRSATMDLISNSKIDGYNDAEIKRRIYGNPYANRRY